MSVGVIKGLKATQETRSQISIIAGQGQTDQDDVVEQAVRLLYSIMPDGRGDRVDLKSFVDGKIQDMQAAADAAPEHAEE